MRGRTVVAYRCRNGCLWMYRHEDCPECGAPLAPTRIPDDATIISHTVVRVNPSGTPVALGVARTRAGATTLCVVRGRVRGNGRDRVRLVTVDGNFHALASGSRLPEFR